MISSLRLGVLDQSPVRSGGTAVDAVYETITHSPKARLRSYELLAEVFGLERRGEQP